jgi:bifunctional DNase/RNase
MVQVTLRAVRVDLSSNTPVLLLQEADGQRRTLPIFIGAPEAAAIAYAVEQVVVTRPMTHDLLASVIQDLGGKLSAVTVTHVEDGTYFAQLELATDTGGIVVSARPSDSVALAVRSGAPIFVEDALMDAEGVVVAFDDDDSEEGEDEEEAVEEFREFLDTIRPEDFSG